MDYIYSKLNEKLEENMSTNYLPTDIESSSTVVSTKLSDNEYRLDVRTDNLVRLIQIKNDLDPSDDVIQRFRLYAYNVVSGKYDIPLGEEIVIDHRNFSAVGNEGGIQITHANIAGQQIPAYIDDQGQLVLQYIPSIAISDKIQVKDEDGNIVYQQVESIIDGNDE